MLIEKINEDFMTAYKAKDMLTKDFLGVLKTEVTRESKTPDDAYIVSKIKSMIKNASATNSLTNDELDILNSYLPKQKTEEELSDIIRFFIEANNLSGIKDMSKVMSFLKSEFDGEYDGGKASQIIKQILNK